MFFKKIFQKLTGQSIDLNKISDDLLSSGMDYDNVAQSIQILKKKNSIDSLREYWAEDLQKYVSPINFEKNKVFLFSGVNGSGKTSTIGKLTYLLHDKYNIKIVAADTFRYAACEQLQRSIHKSCEIIIEANIDPAALVYKSLDNNKHDLVFIDTAGRLPNNKPLIDQLSKIKRSIEKHVKHFTHILVIDTMIGNSVLDQYEIFNNACPIDKIILTKFDAAQKFGMIFNLCRKYNVQISSICFGEGKLDIKDFKIDEFIGQNI